MSDLQEKIKRSKELIREIDIIVLELKESLLEAVGEARLEGVEPIQDSKCNCYTVKFSAIANTPGHILSPEYYLPKAQYEAVAKALDNAHSPEGICNTVKKMIKTKQVKMSTGFTVYLNEATLQVLRNSELGQLAEEGI